MDEMIRVLLVDDEKPWSSKMSTELTSIGLEVEVAASGPEAVEMLRSSGRSFHVAVIDEVMGPPNGTSIMLMLRQLNPALEAIILTGWGDVSLGEKAMALGAYRYMTKPVTPNELAMNIRTAFRFGQERQRGIASEALVQASRQIGDAANEQDLYQRVHAQATDLIPGLETMFIARYDEQNQVVYFPFCHAEGECSELDPRKQGNGITEYVLRTGKPLFLPNGDEGFRREHGLAAPWLKKGYCASELVVPMFQQGRVVGALTAITHNPDVHFTPWELEILQALANQTSAAIQYIDGLEKTAKLLCASTALGSQTNRGGVLEEIVNQAHAMLKSDFTGLILQDEDGNLNKVEPVIPVEFFDKFDEPRKDGLTRHVIKTKQAKVIPDTRLEPLVKEKVINEGICSMLAVPLISGDNVLGVLYAHTFKPRHFSSYEASLWSAFAAQSASSLIAAMERDKQVEATRRLNRALSVLTQKANLKDTIQHVADMGKHVFQADACRLVFIYPATARATRWIWASDDKPEHPYDAEPRENGLTYHVIRTKQPVFSSDINTDTAPSPPQALVDAGLKSQMSLPLVSDGRVTGVLHCNYVGRRQPFTDYHRALFVAFATNAANALERAWRDWTTEIWRKTDQGAANCNDFQTLYQGSADGALEALQADLAVFYPYDPATPTGENPRFMRENCISVSKSDSTWQAHDDLGIKFQQELDRAANSFLIVNDLDKQPNLQSALTTREKIKALVALRLDVVPEGNTDLLRAGILVLYYRHTTTFLDIELTGLRLAGIHIAASIRRLHLHQRWERRTRIWSALAEVLEILRAGANRDRILNLVSEIAREAMSIDFCTIWEYSAQQGAFTQRGQAGLRYPEIEPTIPLIFKDLFMDQLEPTPIPDVEKDERLQGRDFVRREGVKTIVIMPLRTDEPMGLFFANYRSLKNIGPEELDTLRVFAEIIEMILQEARLGEQLGQAKERLQKRLFLNWVSMVEATWHHSLVQNAAAIQNYALTFQKQIEQASLPGELKSLFETMQEIDRLAAEIVKASTPLPQLWEMQSECFQVASILEEVGTQFREMIAREEMLSLAPAGSLPRIEVNSQNLDGFQVRGYRRFIIYAIETLVQNAREALSGPGRVSIVGNQLGDWAEIRVSDTGGGVSDEIAQHLFKELITRDQDKTGRGLGCWLVALIVEDYGGSVALEKTGPTGTTVLIRLPAIPGEMTPNSPRPKSDMQPVTKN